VEDLETRFEKVQSEHFKADEELHDVKEQYNRLVITGKHIEADLTEHLRRAEHDFESRISTLNDQKNNLEREIQVTNANASILASAKVSHKENSVKWNALRHELKALNALKLHQALDNVMHKSEKEKHKLHQIIGYLQHQQHTINQKEMELIARRNVLREAVEMISPSLLIDDSSSSDSMNTLRDRVKKMEEGLENANDRVRVLREEAIDGALRGAVHHGSGHSNSMMSRMSSLRTELLRRAKILEGKLDARLN